MEHGIEKGLLRPLLMRVGAPQGGKISPKISCGVLDPLAGRLRSAGVGAPVPSVPILARAADVPAHVSSTEPGIPEASNVQTLIALLRDSSAANPAVPAPGFRFSLADLGEAVGVVSREAGRPDPVDSSR